MVVLVVNWQKLVIEGQLLDCELSQVVLGQLTFFSR